MYHYPLCIIIQIHQKKFETLMKLWKVNKLFVYLSIQFLYKFKISLIKMFYNQMMFIYYCNVNLHFTLIDIDKYWFPVLFIYTYIFLSILTGIFYLQIKFTENSIKSLLIFSISFISLTKLLKIVHNMAKTIDK